MLHREQCDRRYQRELKVYRIFRWGVHVYSRFVDVGALLDVRNVCTTINILLTLILAVITYSRYQNVLGFRKISMSACLQCTVLSRGSSFVRDRVRVRDLPAHTV